MEPFSVGVPCVTSMHLPAHILEAAVISRLGIAVERTVEGWEGQH
jgi:hypothetical protein